MRQREAPWLPTSPSCAGAHAHILLQRSPRPPMSAPQEQGCRESPSQHRVMCSYALPQTGHTFPASTTSVAGQVPSVPPDFGLCSPVGVSRASFAYYSCLAPLLDRDSVGNNEVGEHKTQSKCTSYNESALGFCTCVCTSCHPAPALPLPCSAHPVAAGSGDSSSSDGV